MTRAQTERAAAAAIALAALAYLAWKALFDRSDTVDFKYLWLAGHLWAQGIDAYGPAFRATGEGLFVGLNPPQTLFYPPNIWPVARIAALLPYPDAILAWRAGSAAMMVGAVGIVAAAVRAGASGPLRPALALLFVGAGTGGAVALSLGQTSPLVLLGLALYVAAYLRRDRLLMAAALTVLVMKPNFGVPLAAFLLTDRHWWASIAGAAAATLACAAPVLLAQGPSGVIAGYLSNLTLFGAHPANAPHSSTGLRSLIGLATGVSVAPMAVVAAGTLGMAALGAVLRRGAAQAPAAGEAPDQAALCLALCAAYLVAPMHVYDAILLAPAILLARPLAPAAQAILALSLIVVLREANLARALPVLSSGAEHFPGSWIVAVATATATLAAALPRRA